MTRTAFLKRRSRDLVLATLVLAACDPPGRSALGSEAPAPILLFNGTGTSPNGVAALEAILNASHLTYSLVDGADLDDMSDARLGSYRLLIMPGGNYITIGTHLTARRATRLREAVQGGVSYLGICAGALLAGSSVYNGLDLTSGVQFGFYAIVEQGVHKAAVPIVGPGTPALEQYWEDGPTLGGWGGAVGRYPDGTPAIVQGTSGSGWVILSGVHAEAPASWRGGMTFSTPVSVDNAYAATLIDAALNRTPLPQF